MELMKYAAEQFLRGIGGGQGLNVTQVASSLGALLGGPDGKLNLSGLLAAFKGQGLGNLVGSWLGDGQNEAINKETVLSVFDDSKISQFAGALNLDKSTAAQGLAAALPALIDKSSEGGSLKNAAGEALSSFSKMF